MSVVAPGGPRRPQGETLEQVDRFALTIESLPNAVVLVEADGKIALVNAELERLFGYSREELIGRSVEMLLPVVGREGPGILAAAAAGTLEPGPDLLGRRHDGSLFPVEIGCASVSTKLGPCMLATVVDITARRRAEDV